MSRRSKKETDAELEAKLKELRARVPNLFSEADRFTNTDGAAPAATFEWKDTFKDELGIQYNIRRIPPEEDAPAAYLVTFHLWRGGGDDEAVREKTKILEAAGKSRAQLILRELEAREAEYKRREINNRNAKKNLDVTREDILERWKRERNEGMTYHKFRTTQEVSERTVDRAVPKKERH